MPKKSPFIFDKKLVTINENCFFGENVKIHENVKITNSKISDNVEIFSGTEISDSIIGEGTTLSQSVIEKSIVGKMNEIGPFSHLRPNSKTEDNVKIGNFVEIKNSTLCSGVKANHLAYIGDAYIGKNTNIGCGVIFVNYNGKIKQRSQVGENCFIGSNVNVIAPVNLSDGSYVCAGTTITEDTNPYDFVIGRVKPTVKPDKAKSFIKEKD